MTREKEVSRGSCPCHSSHQGRPTGGAETELPWPGEQWPAFAGRKGMIEKLLLPFLFLRPWHHLRVCATWPSTRNSAILRSVNLPPQAPSTVCGSESGPSSTANLSRREGTLRMECFCQTLGLLHSRPPEPHYYPKLQDSVYVWWKSQTCRVWEGREQEQRSKSRAATRFSRVMVFENLTVRALLAPHETLFFDTIFTQGQKRALLARLPSPFFLCSQQELERTARLGGSL